MDGVYLGCFEGLYVPQIHMYESLCVCLHCMWYSEIQGKNMWESWNKPWSALVQVLYFIFLFFLSLTSKVANSFLTHWTWRTLTKE